MSIKVQVPANFTGELLLPNMKTTLKANQTITLSDDIFKSADIQLAIQKGFLFCPVSPEVNNDQSLMVKTSPKPKRVKRQKKKIRKATIAIKAPKEPSTKMGSWDASSQKLINKDQSGAQTMKNLNATLASTPQSNVQVNEIDFTNKPVLEDKNKKVSVPKNINNKKIAKGRKAIMPVGEKRLPATGDSTDGFMYANEVQDLSFVDQEQEQERIEQHPKLRDTQTNEEVE